ncbi:hypothetical protein BHE74_00029455 [Ensete ventricosum]|nr:hypothetical protein BHE74_00029455 [Ensete ventricosum]
MVINGPFRGFILDSRTNPKPEGDSFARSHADWYMRRSGRSWSLLQGGKEVYEPWRARSGSDNRGRRLRKSLSIFNLCCPQFLIVLVLLTDGKMDRYQRVEKPREETPINENEIRITTQGRMRNYITYATSLFQYFITELSLRFSFFKDVYMLETTRHVSVIIITLSKKELDTSAVGYQPPLPKDQVKPLAEFDYEEESSPTGRGRGRGRRGGRGRARAGGNGTADYGDGDWDSRAHGYGRGGYSRGRGRGFRGRGRGGYGDQPDYQQEATGYDDESPIPARGRG